jgi:hypothetical protein
MGGHVKNRRKIRERFLLDQFLETTALSVEIIEEGEAPDFVARFEGRRIGIELTDLFKSHEPDRDLPQTQESLSTRIVARAQQLYQESGATPAYVRVCFSPSFDLRALNRDQMARALASFIQELKLVEWQRVDWRPEEIDGPLPQEIAFVHALGVPSLELSHWTVVRAGWAAPLTAEAIQARIAEKSARLPKYQETVRENWLVVVADATRPSQLFESDPQFDASSISSPFSRTFFYSYPRRAVMELGTRHDDAQPVDAPDPLQRASPASAGR